jgi:diguanylate cyclase (GGDEF)-like protein/PAS domain S-box-containing protein
MEEEQGRLEAPPLLTRGPLHGPVPGAAAHRQLEDLLRLQREVLAAIALGVGLEAVLHRVCILIERMVPRSTTTIMLLDQAEGVLNVKAAPSLSAETVNRLNGLVPGTGAGSCGTAASSGRAVYVSDTGVDPTWEQLRELARGLGIRACWSVPILSDAKTVLGTFAISFTERHSPGRFHVRLLETASYLAGIAIQQERRETTLREAAAQLRSVTDAVPGAVLQYRLNQDGVPQLTFISQGAEKLWGIPIERLRQDFRPAWERILPEDQASLRQSILASAGHARPWDQAFRFGRADGSLRRLHLSAAPAISPDGKTMVWNGIVSDVTEHERADERLTQWATAFQNTSEGVMITDPDGRILDVNRAFCEITGYELDEVRDQTPNVLRSGRHDESFYQAMWATLKAAGKWQGEIWNRHKNGGVYPEWLSISQVSNGRGETVNYVGVFADISSIKETELRLLHLAHHDPLTDLPNRLLCAARLGHAIDQAARHPRQLAILFLDLDRFKNINDTLGHALGDELLVQTARRLQECVRQEDTVARLGGDEFVVILENLADPDDAGKVTEKILAALQRPFSLGEHQVVVTASVGVSLYPRDGRDCEILLKHADVAMYRAKGLGRNNHAYYKPELTESAEGHFALEHKLRGALERDELELFFQPQVSAGDNRMVGAEVLLRWRHPELGLVEPGRFLPIAEETGLIRPIGEWVLREACRQALAWRQAGLPALRLAVNLSGQQLTPDGIDEQLEAILRDTGITPSCLELEITESFLMQNPETSVPVLYALKARGISLAIDDFGTGFSSLGHLKRLPVHKLKIDQSLVRDIPADPDDEGTAKAVIALGHSLGLTVIAEGVETERQRDFLRREGCDELQGYLYGHPSPADEFAALLNSMGPAPTGG